MKIIEPQICLDPIEAEDFSEYVQGFLQEEVPVVGIAAKDQRLEHTDLYKLEVRQSTFESCAFLHCSLEKSSFTDVVFRNCSLSNSCFSDAYFERCSFVSCKCIGTNMSGAVLKQITLRQCNLQYAALDEVRLTDVLFDTVDFTEASMTEAKLKHFEASNCRFIQNNLFKTMLSGVDFTENEFLAPTVSNPPAELNGIKINMLQAADLIGLWGPIVMR